MLQRITEENTSASRTLEAHTDERIRQLTEENISLHESIQEMNTAIEELKSMLMLNQNSVEVLERDMECVRDMDTSIFDSSKKSFFDKVTTAQSGEDSIIAYVLMVLGVRPEDITYLDLGANHARELSNTYYFYQQGASGVLVEANPDLIPELKLMRSRDIILNSCVSDHDDDVVNFFIVNGDGLSTSNFEAINNAMTINKNLKIAKTEKIRTITIQSILNNYVQKPPTILNIDIEGEEMNVLQNYDFEHYRPTVICVEMIPYETSLVIDKKNSAVTDYLCGMGYTEYAFTGINSIFVDRNILKGCESA